MSLKPTEPDRSGTAPLARPFLRALSRMQDRTVSRPGELTDRALALLNETYGLEPSAAEAAFSHGVLGLMSEHTHFFNGFAVLMPIAHGTAVAVRTASHGGCRCVVEEGPAVTLEAGQTDPRMSLLVRLFNAVRPGPEGIDIAVVGSIPAWWWEVDLTALGVAAARAMQALFARADESIGLMETVRACIEASLGQPFGIAYPIAAMDGRPGTPVLVDTEAREYLMLGALGSDEVGWGALHVDVNAGQVQERFQRILHRASEALDMLKRHGFSHLTSFREIEHRDLERVLEALPNALVPTVRYLVTENRRVQKLVVAIRRRDWQMMGALMLMSHASQRDDLKSTTKQADHLVSRVEGMSLEGLYGARATGRSGTTILAGQPFAIPNFLDSVQSELREQFDEPAEALLL